MHFICRFFSGNSESRSWSRYWENDPDDPFLKSSKGHLFVLVNISSDEDKELNSIGHDINFEFNQNYFNSDNQLDILSNLQQSINSIIKNPLYASYKIDFSAAVVLNNQIFLAAFGNSKIIFKHQNKISIILNNPDDQIETIVGTVQDQDRFFLLTNSFFEKITWQKIKLFLSDPKIQNVEENFLSSIFSLADQKDLAAALVEIEPDNPNDQDLSFPPIVDQPSTPDNTVNFQKPKFSFSQISQIINDHQKDKSVFISHHQTRQTLKRKKIGVAAAIVFLICLTAGLNFGIKKNTAQKTEDQYQKLKIEVESQIENINKTKTLSLESASQIATAAQETVQKMSDLKIHQQETESYSSQLKDILAQTGSAENNTPDFFYDISTINTNSQFQKIIFNDNKIYLLDSTNGSINSVDISSKAVKPILVSEKVKAAINFSFDKTNFYLMTPKNISLIEKDNLTPKISLENITPTDFKFWNGAAYVLDSNSQAIWKFTPNFNGFSDAKSWIKDGLKLDFGAASLSINGKIWVLYQNGVVTPFLSGVKESFVPSQASQFTQASNIDVAQEKDLLAFVDNDNTIYLYQKTGELLKKFNFGNFKIKDIVFDEKNNFIYILGVDQKLYRQSF